MFEFHDHDLAPGFEHAKDAKARVRYELKPVKTPRGAVAEGLYAAWITLDNPAQYNSYTTDMVKDVILSFRKASNARDVVAVVFTGAGDRAFCTGGNTKEYAEYYSGRPMEYAQYMRLFNDMVSSILECDKPVVCRVNGMRIGGGQEIGMACDFSIASDLASFGQAGPKHGSAPDGGATDFLPLFVGIEAAMWSCTVCEPWTAYQAKRLGLLTDVVPACRHDGELIANPMVVTDEWVRNGRIVWGEQKTGAALAEGKELFKKCTVDLSALDAAVDKAVTSLMMTMPGCLSRTIESLRKHKLEHWDKNREGSRSWLALNMLAEGKAGFRAFNEGTKECREVDFVALRQRLARGETWSPDFIDSLMPKKG
ncbi:6-oxocyclohex-1-ene-1-carbonyl-CoA hydratase [Myxococcota bacterium]|nr:6-oxocyclohex-1-ene-1-carbonyl-CoA hydratase [Myxococcota bacterium]